MNESEKLRASVRDERARRSWAEKELAREAERAQLWRQRAEERTARIGLLQDRLAASTSISWLSRVRTAAVAVRRVFGKASESPAPAVAAPTRIELPGAERLVPDTVVRRTRMAYPFVKVAAMGGEDLPFLSQFDTAVLDENSLFDADIVFVTSSRLAECDAGVTEELTAWTRLPARQPFVVWQNSRIRSELEQIVQAADLKLGPGIEGLEDSVEQFFPGVKNDDWPATEPGSEESRRQAVIARRDIWQTKSAARRATRFLHLLHADVPDIEPAVGVLLISNKPDHVVAAVEAVLRQTYQRRFVVVGLHGEPKSFDNVREQLADLLGADSAVVLAFDPMKTLGQCLNEAAAACSCPLLAKFDDDDWYGPHYLEDAIAALEYSQADLVGKACYFVEIEESRDTYLVTGPEECHSDHVIGSSLVFRRSLWERVPFPHRPSRVDSIFLRGVRAVGGKIYSNTRYEFGVRRRQDGHTWIVDPAHFAARGERVGDTFADIVINVDDETPAGEAS